MRTPPRSDLHHEAKVPVMQWAAENSHASQDLSNHQKRKINHSQQSKTCCTHGLPWWPTPQNDQTITARNMRAERREELCCTRPPTLEDATAPGFTPRSQGARHAVGCGKQPCVPRSLKPPKTKDKPLSTKQDLLHSWFALVANAAERPDHHSQEYEGRATRGAVLHSAANT